MEFFEATLLDEAVNLTLGWRFLGVSVALPKDSPKVFFCETLLVVYILGVPSQRLGTQEKAPL